MVLGVAGIAQLVGDVARGDERIAGPENEDLVCDDHLELSGEDIVRLVLTRMRMSRHTHAGRESHLEEAVCSSSIRARQTYRTDAHVEV